MNNLFSTHKEISNIHREFTIKTPMMVSEFMWFPGTKDYGIIVNPIFPIGIEIKRIITEHLK